LSGISPSLNDSESDTGLGPMTTPVNRLASASSTATGGSSRSVYLHAAAVADIPPGTQMQNRTLSKDNVSNHVSRINEVTKKNLAIGNAGLRDLLKQFCV